MKVLICGISSIVMVLQLVFPSFIQAQNKDKTPVTENLQERIKAIEERLNRLDSVPVIKEVREYLCSGGEIHDALPPGGRCPDGTLPKERITFKTRLFSRRESISEKIEAALEEAESSRVAVGGSARGILQQLVNSRDEDKLFSTGSVDLFFLSRPMTRATFFVDLQTIGGAGPDEVLGSLSRVNSDAETFAVKDDVKVKEAWLLKRLMGDHLMFVAGKLDLSNYFDRNEVANDETTRFLNAALVNNPILQLPQNGPALALRYEPGGAATWLLGFQSSEGKASGIATKILAIAELDYRIRLLFSRLGNIRLWIKTGRLEGTLEKKTRGAGLSFDQQVTPLSKVFARYGLGKTEDAGKKEYAWSTGFEIKAPFDAFPRDRLGLGFSRQSALTRSESLAEGYYQHYVTDRLAIAFDLQWLFSGTNSITGEKQDNVLLPGFRTTVNF